MSSKSGSVSFEITKDRREKISEAIRKAMKAALGHERIGDLVALDRRYTNRKGDAEKKIAGYTGYERFCEPKSGRTIYVSLADPNNPQATVSKAADKYAQGKAEKKLERVKAREERQAKKSATKPKAAKSVKAEAKS